MYSVINMQPNYKRNIIELTLAKNNFEGITKMISKVSPVNGKNVVTQEQLELIKTKQDATASEINETVSQLATVFDSLQIKITLNPLTYSSIPSNKLEGFEIGSDTTPNEVDMQLLDSIMINEKNMSNKCIEIIGLMGTAQDNFGSVLNYLTQYVNANTTIFLPFVFNDFNYTFNRISNTNMNKTILYNQKENERKCIEKVFYKKKYGYQRQGSSPAFEYKDTSSINITDSRITIYEKNIQPTTGTHAWVDLWCKHNETGFEFFIITAARGTRDNGDYSYYDFYDHYITAGTRTDDYLYPDKIHFDYVPIPTPSKILYTNI